MKKNNLILLSLIILTIFYLTPNVKAGGKSEDSSNKCSSGFTQVGNMCQKITNAYQRDGQYYCPPGSGTLDQANKKCVISYTLEEDEDDSSDSDDKTTISCASGYISDGKKCHKIVGQASYRDGSYYCDPKTYPDSVLIGTACVEGSVKEEIVDPEQTKPSKPGNNNNTELSEEEQEAEEIKNQYIGNMTCGGITNFKFHKRIPKLTSTFYNLLKTAIPVLLVIKGMMDLFKSMSSGKEDEMKKNQKKFINRLIAGVCAFIVFVLVETIIGWIAPKTGNENAMSCVNCFINNSGCVEITSSHNNA